MLLLTLSGGDHAAVVRGEEHLRLAVFGHEYLVLAGGAVAGLDHGVATHGSQVAAGDITQRDTAQLARRPACDTATTIRYSLKRFNDALKLNSTTRTRHGPDRTHTDPHGLFCGETPLGPCGSGRVRVVEFSY